MYIIFRIFRKKQLKILLILRYLQGYITYINSSICFVYNKNYTSNIGRKSIYCDLSHILIFNSYLSRGINEKIYVILFKFAKILFGNQNGKYSIVVTSKIFKYKIIVGYKYTTENLIVVMSLIFGSA